MPLDPKTEAAIIAAARKDAGAGIPLPTQKKDPPTQLSMAERIAKYERIRPPLPESEQPSGNRRDNPASATPDKEAPHWDQDEGPAHGARTPAPTANEAADRPEHPRFSATPFLLIAALIAVAMLPMPYGYYGVMRWVVCAAFAYLAVQAHADGRDEWMWVWIVAAGVYNPIFKVAASREVWTVVNLVTFVVVGAGWWTQRYRKVS